MNAAVLVPTAWMGRARPKPLRRRHRACAKRSVASHTFTRSSFNTNGDGLELSTVNGTRALWRGRAVVAWWATWNGGEPKSAARVGAGGERERGNFDERVRDRHVPWAEHDALHRAPTPCTRSGPHGRRRLRLHGLPQRNGQMKPALAAADGVPELRDVTGVTSHSGCVSAANRSLPRRLWASARRCPTWSRDSPAEPGAAVVSSPRRAAGRPSQRTTRRRRGSAVPSSVTLTRAGRPHPGWRAAGRPCRSRGPACQPSGRRRRGNRMPHVGKIGPCRCRVGRCSLRRSSV